jgi:hypothetical protein
MSNEASSDDLPFHIITIRLIRSFHHRNLKNIIIRDVCKNMSVKDLKLLINEGKFVIYISNFCFVFKYNLIYLFYE